MKAIIAAAMLGIAGLATAAQAQPIDQRHVNQDRRIDNGIRNGSLTPREAARVERQQASIDRQESRMRYRHYGHLTPRDRAVLRYRENRASHHIYRAKHNWRGA